MTPPARNVLLITLHDTRPMFGCLGDPDAATPQFDQFAQSAVTFDRAYCQSPQCGPSRAALFSGLYPERSGITHNTDVNGEQAWQRLRAQNPAAELLPMRLRRAGYFTFCIGAPTHKWGGSDREAWSAIEPRAALHQQIIDTPNGPAAFTSNYACEETRRATAVRNLNARQRGFDAYAAAKASLGPMIECGPTEELYRDYLHATRTIEALRVLGGLDRPFFLATGLHAGHLPFVAPQWAWDANPINRIAPPEPAEVTEGSHDPFQAASHSGEHDGLRQDEPYADGDRPGRGAQTQLARQAYRAAITSTDRQVGRILEALDVLGLSDHTVVVICADHGLHVGERRRWGKATLFELDCHVPLWIRLPGGKTKAGNASADTSGGGRRCSALVELIDVYPTLCDVLGLEAPAHLQGRSLAPLLVNPGGPHKTAAFTTFGRRDDPAGPLARRLGQSVTDGRFRYTRYRQADGRFLEDLYDHDADPGETRNLAADPAFVDQCLRLARLIDERDRMCGRPIEAMRD